MSHGIQVFVYSVHRHWFMDFYEINSSHLRSSDEKGILFVVNHSSMSFFSIGCCGWFIYLAAVIGNIIHYNEAVRWNVRYQLSFDQLGEVYTVHFVVVIARLYSRFEHTKCPRNKPFLTVCMNYNPPLTYTQKSEHQVLNRPASTS